MAAAARFIPSDLARLHSLVAPAELNGHVVMVTAPYNDETDRYRVQPALPDAAPLSVRPANLQPLDDETARGDAIVYLRSVAELMAVLNDAEPQRWVKLGLLASAAPPADVLSAMLGVRITSDAERLEAYVRAEVRASAFGARFPGVFEQVEPVCPRYGAASSYPHGTRRCPCTRRPGNLEVTPAELALLHLDEPAARKFVRSGVEPAAQVREKSGRTLFHRAVVMGFPDFAHWLATDESLPAAWRVPSLLTRADCYGQTPLHCAAANSYEGLVRLLLAAGADPSGADEDGYTALHGAAGTGVGAAELSLGVARALLSAIEQRGGADAARAAIMAPAGAGPDTPLCFACMPKRKRASQVQLLRLFHEKGARFLPSCRARADHPCTNFMCHVRGCVDICGLPEGEALRRLRGEQGSAAACAACDAPGATLQCARCRIAMYCGRECQRRHWRAAHKAECGARAMQQHAEARASHSQAAAAH